MIPVSLLASMTDTIAGRGSAARNWSRRARSTIPLPSTATLSASGTASSTELCSTAETRMRSRPLPMSARWFASVPPLTKITPSGAAPISAATASRARSTFCRAARPQRCTEEGLPQLPSAATAAAAASGRSGAVAFQSRYVSRWVMRTAAARTCVLRDALLRSAPQDEVDLYVASKAHLILRSPRSGRLEGRT